MKKCVITITSSDDDTADISLAFDPPVSTDRDHTPDTVEVLAGVALKAITDMVGELG